MNDSHYFCIVSDFINLEFINLVSYIFNAGCFDIKNLDVLQLPGKRYKRIRSWQLTKNGEITGYIFISETRPTQVGYFRFHIKDDCKFSQKFHTTTITLVNNNN